MGGLRCAFAGEAFELAGRRATALQNPGIQIGVENAAAALRYLNDGRTFAERNEPFERAPNAASALGSLVVGKNFHRCESPCLRH
jgi:hypothetical protein